METIRGDPGVQQLLLEIQQKQAGLQSAYDALNAHLGRSPPDADSQPQGNHEHGEAYPQGVPVDEDDSPSATSPPIEAGGPSAQGSGAVKGRQHSNTARIILTWVLSLMAIHLPLCMESNDLQTSVRTPSRSGSTPYLWTGATAIPSSAAQS
jgi:hypothetical protein